MRWIWGGGIRRKLAVSFSLLIGAIAALIVVFFPNRLERQARRAHVARAEAVRDMTAYSLSAGLYFADSTAIFDVLRGAARDREVMLLEVRDRNDSLVAALRGAEVSGAATYTTSTRVVHAGESVGTLVLGISLEELRREVAAARRLGLLTGLLIFVVGLGIVYLISTVATRPLLDVVHAVKRIGAGDLSIRALATRDADTGPLVTAFNQMVDTLVGAQSELSRINQELEQRVEARTSELQDLIDLAPQAIVSLDLEGMVTRWNRAAEALFGWSAEEVLGKPVPYVTSEQHESLRRNLALLRETRGSYSAEVVRTRKDGRPVNLLLSAGVVCDARDEPAGYIAFLADLSERRSLEEQLRQSQKMEAIGRLAGGIAHDFNNILTIITSCASLLRDGDPTPQQLEDIDEIAGAATRAAALTRQLLTFSRKHLVQLEPVYINDVVQNLGPMLRRLLRENIRVTTTLGPDVGFVTADPRQLEQVLMNLVVNASDAMPNGGSLTLDTRRAFVDEAFAQRRAGLVPGEYAAIAVRDSGVGMDDATREKIFEPFFTTKGPGQGTGLGLATVYAVISQLNGYVDVETAPGEGATFTIYLPTSEQGAEALPPALTPLLGARGREAVLLVEDETSVRQSIRRNLERLGYLVFEASNGEAALALCRESGESIDVVVTDVMMPGMNGRELADRLQTSHPELRVVFMSGYTDDAIRERGLVDETHVFLQKPFGGPELGHAIRLLLDRPTRARA